MNARPFDHVDVSIGGLIASGGQTWSCTFTCAALDHSNAPGDTTSADLATICDDVHDALAGPGPLLSLMGSDASVQAIRAYLRLANQSSAAFVGENNSIMGCAGTPDVPPQIAAVVTLLTGAAGRKNRGRVYWPVAGTTDRLLTSGQNSTYANETADLIAQLRTSLSSFWGTDAGPVIGNNGFSVESVRCDNVADTQRRRRDKVVPTSVVNVVIPVP